ncbi:hypothetical protein GCM10027423_34570 [Spirosoma arcticum]
MSCRYRDEEETYPQIHNYLNGQQTHIMEYVPAALEGRNQRPERFETKKQKQRPNKNSGLYIGELLRVHEWKGFSRSAISGYPLTCLTG